MTVAHQVPLSVEFPRQEYWSGLPCPPPGDLPNPWIEPRSPALQVDSLPSELPGKPWSLWRLGQVICFCEPVPTSVNGNNESSDIIKSWEARASLSPPGCPCCPIFCPPHPHHQMVPMGGSSSAHLPILPVDRVQLTWTPAVEEQGELTQHETGALVAGGSL